MRLMFDMVVIGHDCLGPLQVTRANSTEQTFLDQQRDVPPIFFRKPTRQPCVTEVCSADVISRFQALQTSADRFPPRQMMIANCRPESAGTAVDHEPEPPGFVCLQLDEMISAPDCGELQDTRRVPQRLQPQITQYGSGKIAGHRNGPSPVSAPSGYRVPQASEDSAGDARFAD